MINSDYVAELLRTKENGRLYHREGQELEYKEQFNFAGLADYFRDFAGFANNRGGYMVFGVTDSPRTPAGLSESALDQFDKLDPEKITGYLLDIFSPSIDWEHDVFEYQDGAFGVFRVYEALEKPVIAKKDEGKDHTIKNGSVYYRYGGRTQVIQFAELESIINHRIERNNKQWMDLVEKIGRSGPKNAAVLDTERSVIEKDDSQILVVDDNLASKLTFIKEGRFEEKDGAPTLKLIGDVVPIEQIEVVKRVRENLTSQYPMSAIELAQEVKRRLPKVKQYQIWDAIKENDAKDNRDYSAYIFCNKRDEDRYKETGELPSVVASIYNTKALDFLVNVLRTEVEDN